MKEDLWGAADEEEDEGMKLPATDDEVPAVAPVLLFPSATETLLSGMAGAAPACVAGAASRVPLPSSSRPKSSRFPEEASPGACWSAASGA